MYQGIFVPLTTPFDRDGSLRLDALKRNIVKYADSSLAGGLVLGSTGEAVHLTLDERLAVVTQAGDAAPGDFALLCGLPGSSIVEAEAFLERASLERFSAVLAGVPGYYRSRMSNQALKSYYKTLADLSPVPILLYNIPKFSGIELDVSLVQDLCSHPNIAGLKESSGNLIYLQKLLDATEEQEFSVLSGSAETFGPAAALGVRGGILAIACVLPDLPGTVYRSWKSSSGDIQSLQKQLFSRASAIVGRFSVPGVKYGMDIRGFEGLHCREPLQDLTDVERRQVENLLEGN